MHKSERSTPLQQKVVMSGAVYGERSDHNVKKTKREGERKESTDVKATVGHCPAYGIYKSGEEGFATQTHLHIVFG